jgi:hypothetical protein
MKKHLFFFTFGDDRYIHISHLKDNETSHFDDHIVANGIFMIGTTEAYIEDDIKRTLFKLPTGDIIKCHTFPYFKKI